MPTTFGPLLREFRLRMGIGLREFADKIQLKASNLSAMENDARPPIRDLEKLRQIAELLGLKEHSSEWEMFFNAARKPKTLPADVSDYPVQSGAVLSLLRTVDRHQPSEEDLEEIFSRIKAHLEGTSNGDGKSR